MEKIIRSLHHVTATVSDAQEDLDFYIKVLGTRLVKKTVNFDNHNVYHFYYGDERGTPNTLMTTFPYRGWGVREGVQGAGQVTVTAFSVPEGSLDSWRSRLRDANIDVRDVGERFGEEVIAFDDPSGLVIELVANRNDERTPWVAGGVSADHAVRGLYGITMSIRDPQRTLALLTVVLTYEIVNEEDRRIRLAVNGNLPGHIIDVLHSPDAPDAVNGLGTVHHVAMAVADEDEQLRVRKELINLGLEVTEVRDRCYFKSIYFREPGGVLYEVATLGPGFDVDEELSELGTHLRLPGWEEPNRAEIMQGLATVSY